MLDKKHMTKLRQKIITIPKDIYSTYEGYIELLRIFQCYVQYQQQDFEEVILDFYENTWFDANLLPIVYAFVEYGYGKYNIKSKYRNQPECKLHKILIRNNFGKLCFGLGHEPQEKETVVPFKIFKSDGTYEFANYIDAEIVRYFPAMDNDVKRDISAYIQELFGNAQIHGNCLSVYTCGQYYPTKHKMDFTIVNLGTTIKTNVIEYLKEIQEEIPNNCINWAVEPQHSTKRESSGGMGLSLMKDFIHFNKGKYQIISGNEFWELDKQNNNLNRLDYYFPGTIINIEIDQNDTNKYKYKEIAAQKIMDNKIF